MKELNLKYPIILNLNEFGVFVGWKDSAGRSLVHLNEEEAEAFGKMMMECVNACNGNPDAVRKKLEWAEKARELIQFRSFQYDDANEIAIKLLTEIEAIEKEGA